MNRAHLRQLAEDRIVEARALLDAGHWSGAYYLVGYAVECGLKSCVLAHIENTGAIFQDKKFSEKCWTHDIDELVKLAGLESTRGLGVSANPSLGLNWLIVKDWNEAARYARWTETEARELYEGNGSGQSLAPSTARFQRSSSARDLRGMDSRDESNSASGNSHSPSSIPFRS